MITAVAIVGGIAACEPKTSMTQVWSAEVAQPIDAEGRRHGYAHDEANRRVLEDTLVAGLGAHGVQAIPAYKLFPDSAPNREQAKAVVQSVEADGVLVATFKGIRRS